VIEAISLTNQPHRPPIPLPFPHLETHAMPDPQRHAATFILISSLQAQPNATIQEVLSSDGTQGSQHDQAASEFQRCGDAMLCPKPNLEGEASVFETRYMVSVEMEIINITECLCLN